MQEAHGKMLMEPGNVTDLPNQRIDDIEPRTDKLLRRESGNELQCSRAGIPQHGGEACGGDRNGHDAISSPVWLAS